MTAKFLFLFLSTLLLGQSVLGEWRWTDKVAVVTGASSGIGAEIAVQLANRGMKVAALARRTHRLEELVHKTTGEIYPVTCDLRIKKDVKKSFRWIEENLGGVDVLINNAGVSIPSGISDGEAEYWENIFEVNTLGLAMCSREALKTMRTRGDNGQIININSLVGHQVLHVKNFFNGVYTASKYAVTAISKALANELTDTGSKIKVTNLSPGLVLTELITNMTNAGLDIYKDKSKYIEVDDVAEGVIYILSTKPNIRISELTIQQMGSESCP